jgi:glycosyltransferase involved in cell wall biosynthesis
MISVIVTTYNWPDALNLCIQSLLAQTDNDFEIIIADDGSKKDTEELVKGFQQTSCINIKYIWQEDLGFRKTMILNKAIEVTEGEYIIFLDGDCITQPDFIEKHRMLRQANIMVTGSRILLNRSLTKKLCAEPNLDFDSIKTSSLLYLLSGSINKFMPLWIKLPSSSLRNYKEFVWRRIKGCNMAAWRHDIVNVSGFSEEINGWGHEDADFVFRLHLSGIKRRSGSWCTEVLHLYHSETNKSRDKLNLMDLQERIFKNKTK